MVLATRLMIRIRRIVLYLLLFRGQGGVDSGVDLYIGGNSLEAGYRNNIYFGG